MTLPCQELRELLHLRDDGELLPDELSRVDEHLERCGDCRALREEIRDLRQGLARLGEEQPPVGFVERTLASLHSRTTRRSSLWLRWSPVAAAAGILLGTAWFVMQGTGAPPPATDLIAENDGEDLPEKEVAVGRGASEEDRLLEESPKAKVDRKAVGGRGSPGPGAAGPGARPQGVTEAPRMARQVEEPAPGLAAGFVELSPRTGDHQDEEQESAPDWTWELDIDEALQLLADLGPEVPDDALDSREKDVAPPGLPAGGGRGADTDRSKEGDLQEGAAKSRTRRGAPSGGGGEGEGKGLSLDQVRLDADQPREEAGKAGDVRDWRAVREALVAAMGPSANLQLVLRGAGGAGEGAATTAFVLPRPADKPKEEGLGRFGAPPTGRDAEPLHARLTLRRVSAEDWLQELEQKAAPPASNLEEQGDTDRDQGPVAPSVRRVLSRATEADAPFWVLTLEFLPRSGPAPDEGPAPGDGPPPPDDG